MSKTIRQRIRKPIFFLLLGFLLLFIFRLAYGYTIRPNDYSHQSQFFNDISQSRKNYASKEYKVKGNASSPSLVRVDQKYEKIAAVNTKSTAFEEEEKVLRQNINNHNALIQFEQKNGNKGQRKLHLVIGVPPENFDQLYDNLIQIGQVVSKQITKKDKTNEYKELNAKKASLEKIRSSLIELKSKGGKIEEYMGLENRILEIEQQLQDLGDNLGDFDDENEFCTVKFSLNEGQEVKISLMHRLKVALEWTVKIYLRMLAMFSFLLSTAFILLLVIDKLKIFEKLMK